MDTPTPKSQHMSDVRVIRKYKNRRLFLMGDYGKGEA